MKIGIALAPDRLVAVLPNGRQLETNDCADLGAALAQLRATVNRPRATVTVALLPPLVDVRRVTLPRLRDDERRRVLVRDAARYFLTRRDPQAIGAVVLDSSATPVPILAAAAPDRLVTAIEDAVAATGWTLRAIVPAHAAWAAGVRARWPDKAAGGGHLIVRLADATEVLRLESGRPVDRRRFRAGPADQAKIAELVQASAATDRVTDLPEPVAFAARFAPPALRPELCSERRLAARARRSRRMAVAFVGAATVCLVLAAGFDAWGLRRELAAVRGARAAIAPEVAAAMADRDSLGALAGSLGALAGLESSAPRWSVFLTDLAEYLPSDAHLVGLRASGDSAAVAGVARQAATVFQALQQMPSIAGLRAEAPIRQDVTADGTVREQFTLGTRLRSVP